MIRREFIRAETMVLGRFLAGSDERTLVGWRRVYRCECGYRCVAAGDIYDHARACGPGIEGGRRLTTGGDPCTPG